MASFIMANGKTENVTEEENKYGKMVHFFKVAGITIWRMDKEG